MILRRFDIDPKTHPVLKLVQQAFEFEEAVEQLFHYFYSEGKFSKKSYSQFCKNPLYFRLSKIVAEFSHHSKTNNDLFAHIS